MKRICIDPGHGMGNRQRGKYDPGATFGTYTEAAIVMDWANELRAILKAQGHTVVRTRVDDKDPAPVTRRDDIATAYECERMLSLHCNAGGGRATGAEVFYRGADDKAFAVTLSQTVASSLGIPNRGAKTEKESQHKSLSVLTFDKCWLIELGFIDHPGDRAKMLDPVFRRKACEALAAVLTA